MRIVVASGEQASGEERTTHYLRRLRVLPGVDLVDAGPDAVVVCGETSHRRELTERAAAAGAHVLCEPPLAGSEADAEAMIDACSRAGVSLTLACPVRFSPAFDAVRRAVADGGLGRLTAVNGTYHTAQATHLMDLVDVLLDGEPADEVYGQASTVAPASVIVVRYPSGTVATMDHGYGATSVELVGDRATVRFDPFARLLDVRGTGRDDSGAADLDAAMLGAFVTGVRDGWPDGPDGAAGLRGLRIALAAHRSLSTGLPEPVG